MSLRIEFGANGRKMDGWICTDIDTADIRKFLNWSDNSCEQLYCSHCIEHVSSPHAIHFLMECHRILQPGGTLRLVVPCVGSQMRRDEVLKLVDHTHGHLCAYNEDLLRTMLFTAGFEWGKILRTGRKPIDAHHLTIGDTMDNLESCHLEATKT